MIKATPVSMERLLWTAVVIVGASLPHWRQLSPWVPALLATAVIWRLAAEILGWRLPNRALRLLMAFLAFTAVLVQHNTINGLEAGSALLVVMVALKFLESRTQRDQLVLIIISYFLVFASFLSQRNLLAVVYLLGFVWFTTVGLLQLGRQGLLLGNWLTLKLAGRLLLQALPIMLLLFVLFPRLPGPLWAIPGSTSTGRTGLSDTMSPGDLTELGLSDEVAFRVEFFGRPPPADRLYWRGPVMQNFNGRTWSAEYGNRGDMRRTIEYVSSPISYRVMLEPHDRRWAFALDMPREWSEDQNIRMDGRYQLLRRGRGAATNTRVEYEVTSYTEYRALEELTDRQRAAYLNLPPDSNPRSQSLARQWRAETSDPQEIIRNALALFRAETFYYTLTPPPLGLHPADEFLFETREGFCEHYSSAFTVLMRAAGIPARVVTGYQGGELNPLGRYYVVRQTEAHAWTEVWLEDEGWVRVDPTAAVAPDRIRFGLSGASLSGDRRPGSALGRIPLLRSMALAWDALNTYWSDWVLDYGPELQHALLEGLGFEEPHWSKLVLLAVISIGLILLSLTVYLAFTYRQSIQRDPAARHFARFCSKLSARRVPARLPTEGPADFGRRAAQALPGADGDIRRIIAAYLAARYERGDTPAALERLRKLVAAFNPAGIATEAARTKTS